MSKDKSASSLVAKVVSASSSVTSTFIEHNQFMKKFLARFLKCEQDIEDVVQEVYIRAVSAENERNKAGQSIDQPKAFLFTIAKNLALNELNRKSRQATDYIEDCMPSYAEQQSESLESEHDAELSLGTYCEAVAALPEKCRKVYLLRKVHGLPHKEIAKQLDISLSSVEKYLKLGIVSCHAALKEQPNSRTKKVQVRR
ncbi:RNA polymerase sigma factor [Gayadomonas joobiniege]|uniref:RNA polymerase sigma factor n=1 Tax=Gayadomonas joobiniege TaxID=1234606 RepID=UPI000366EC69|nr:RNA polymerase sigma factor [Gayadomonas joobiniege]